MALNDWELSYNGLTVGGFIDVTGYDITDFEGFEGFDVRSNDQVLPSFWGVQAGGDFVNPRVMTLGIQAFPELTPEAAAFEAAFVPSAQVTPTALMPLVMKIPNQVERLVMCRVRRRTRTRSNGVGNEMAKWLVQLDAPDPRIYASALSSAVMTSFVADSTALNSTTGSGADLAFDGTAGSGADLAFDAGGTAGGGGVALVNAGNVDTYPAFTFQTSASMATWHVINDTTGEQASFAFALVPGYSLVADMAGVATGSTVPPVTLNGVANYPIWQAPRVPVRLIPGINNLRFFVDSGTAAGSTCTVAYRDAYL